MLSLPTLLNGASIINSNTTYLLRKSNLISNNRVEDFENVRFISTSRRRLGNLDGATYCRARRRSVRYDDEEEQEEYGNNEEIGVLELYTQYARGEALIVKALLDDEQVEVLIFKGMSSNLTYGTLPDPSKSIIPARAIITSIDRIRGPFNPSDIEYIEKGISWDAFKGRL
ncbi:hypothetical protein ACFE04_020091 [Oxalis oulophora]